MQYLAAALLLVLMLFVLPWPLAAFLLAIICIAVLVRD